GLRLAVAVSSHAGLRPNRRGLGLRRAEPPGHGPRRPDSRRADPARVGPGAPLDPGADHREELRVPSSARAARLSAGRHRARVGLQARPLARRHDPAAPTRLAVTQGRGAPLDPFDEPPNSFDAQRRTDMNLQLDHVMKITERPSPVMVRGAGSWLWDRDGKRYLHFVPGVAVTLLGDTPR